MYKMAFSLVFHRDEFSGAVGPVIYILSATMRRTAECAEKSVCQETEVTNYGVQSFCLELIGNVMDIFFLSDLKNPKLYCFVIQN